ncbi:TPA: hypothetical protein ACXKAZ_000343 [Pseudomonas aeruginosa]|uniref:hypothetical protein n=1 Tax=Pseudomonas aeruginosa TaxID=287 RepID=UPI001151FBB1|nr:hypothetical protein [Pseudomonas aeruginosa]MBF3053389.1 hypothetical protein [Pseudomonas aeruginosa]MDC9031417.1 hypothetical protein [Pseudomonas aeruginosa]TQI24221.1 hypothetical protein FLI93_00705 [Pseudomonas aeruginosa]
MTISALVAVDAVLCALVVFSALELLRTVHISEHPILCVAFYLVAIGAFGVLLELFRGVHPSSGSVLLHVGVVLYAWCRRKHIFRDDWSWDGTDRRRQHR